MLGRLFRNAESLPQKRARMVEAQLRARGIRDERVLAAMGKVPREEFISNENGDNAYGDYPLPIGAGQTISQPYIVASMIEALEVRPEDRVLEVGTGTGYQAAILGELSAEVWTIERHAELADKAREILQRLGYTNVHVVTAMEALAWRSKRRSTRSWSRPRRLACRRRWSHSLADGGRLVVPVGSRAEQQVLVVRKMGEQTVVTPREGCRFVPLVGEQGWEP